jgi:hypothetical protein
MKPRTLLAVALTLASPVVHGFTAPRTAQAQGNKDASPAKREIADADYDCKELSRLVGLSGWESQKSRIASVEDQAKSCEGNVAKVKKADPKWNVGTWEKLISDARARAKKAKDGLGSAAPAKADTGPDASKSPASDDIALTKGAVSYLEKKMADPTDLGTDAGKLDTAKSALKSVQGGLKRIKAADPKWDVSAWEKIAKDAEVRVQKGEQAVSAKGAADSANEHAYSAYAGKLHSVSDGMELLDTLEKKPNEVKIYSKDQIFGNMAKSIAAVGDLDKECKDKHYDKLTVIPSFYVKEIPAVEGCKRAAKWKELGKKFVEIQARGGAKREATRIEGVLADVKKGEKIEAADHERFFHIDDYLTRFKADYDKGGQAFDVVTDVAWYEPIKTATAAYPAALAEAQKTFRWDKQATIVEQGTTATVTKQHQKGGMMDPGQVIKTGSWSEWFVDKDVWNQPVSRSRDVVVLVKITGEAWCRIYARTAGSTFNHGAWAPSEVSGGESKFRISACK